MGNFTEKLNRFFEKTLFPEKLTCNICGREVFHGEFLCEECADTVVFLEDDICQKCGRENDARPEECLSCRHENNIDLSRSIFSYEGGGAILVKKLKYSDCRYLAKYFAGWLKNIYIKNTFAPDVITFVPMTERSLYIRGYNQTELVARELSKLVGAPCVDMLDKVTETPHQAGLDFAERQKNLKGVYELKKGMKVKGLKVLLIDDVLTTGATSGEIASVLKGKGAKSVYLMTIASVNLRMKKITNNAALNS